MRQDQIDRTAKEIIRSNRYLTLATKGQRPWAAPVFYCVDESFNMYFISRPDSVHGQHIAQEPAVAFAIFDSHQPEGTGNGVQGSGQAVLLEGEAIKEALQHYSTQFITITPESLAAPAPYRIYKLVPEEVFILDTDQPVDARVRANLS